METLSTVLIGTGVGVFAGVTFIVAMNKVAKTLKDNPFARAMYKVNPWYVYTWLVAMPIERMTFKEKVKHKAKVAALWVYIKLGFKVK